MFVASLLLVGATACASLGALSTALDVVGSVAGQPANPSSDQTAVAIQAEAGVGDVVVMRGTQGLIVANNAYQGSAAVAEAYVRTGRATPAQLARIRVLSDRALLLLERGEGGLTVAQRAAEVLNIVAELNLFGGRR
jgi:hypothetical protein